MLVIISTLVIVTLVMLIDLITCSSPHYPEYDETFEDVC